MNKSALLLMLLGGGILPSIAADRMIPATEIIEKEGQLNISDGSSIYSFRKDGSFYSMPVGISGRTIDGKWSTQVKGDKSPTGVFTVEGKWGWVNGLSPGNDFRVMTLWIYPLEKAEKINGAAMTNGKVYKCYFLVEELKKKS